MSLEPRLPLFRVVAEALARQRRKGGDALGALEVFHGEVETEDGADPWGVGSKNSPGPPVVEVEQPAEAFPAVDRSA